MLQACGNNYVYQDYLTCPDGCMNGLCADCKPGTSVCSGANTYRVCASGGQLSDEKTCAPGYTCDGGACVATSACTDGQRNCISDAIYTCTGGQWTLFMLCPSDTDCKESSGTAYCAQEARQNQTQPIAPVQPVQPQKSGNSPLGDLGGVFLVTTLLLGGAAVYFYNRKK